MWDTPSTPSPRTFTCLPFRAFGVESPDSWKDPRGGLWGAPTRFLSNPVPRCKSRPAPSWSSSRPDPRPTAAAPQAPADPVRTLASRGGSGRQPPPLASPVHSTQPHCPDYLHRVVFDYVEPDQGHRALAGPE
ncbi:hypothetical protein NN561_018971 [Cricetulus griseus]